MFLEIPVPAKVLGEQVARLLDEAAATCRATSSRESSSLAQRTAAAERASGNGVIAPPGSSHKGRNAFAYGERDGTVDRYCPQSLELLEYRHRWPVLSTRISMANSHGPRDRLRYASVGFVPIRRASTVNWNPQRIGP